MGPGRWFWVGGFGKKHSGDPWVSPGFQVANEKHALLWHNIRRYTPTNIENVCRSMVFFWTWCPFSVHFPHLFCWSRTETAPLVEIAWRHGAKGCDHGRVQLLRPRGDPPWKHWRLMVSWKILSRNGWWLDVALLGNHMKPPCSYGFLQLIHIVGWCWLDISHLDEFDPILIMFPHLWFHHHVSTSPWNTGSPSPWDGDTRPLPGQVAVGAGAPRGESLQPPGAHCLCPTERLWGPTCRGWDDLCSFDVMSHYMYGESLHVHMYIHI